MRHRELPTVFAAPRSSLTFLSSLVLASAFVASSASALQTTWHVDAANCPGPGEGSLQNPYCRIQAAIDQASAGDTIRVHAGLYEESIVLKRGLQVLGDGPATTTIFGGNDPGDVVSSIGATDVRFSGFRVTGAHAGGSLPGGAGILVNHPNATVVIENVEVHGNDFGIAMFMSRDQLGPDIRNSNIHHNDMAGILSPGNGLISGNVIWANQFGLQVWTDSGSPVVRNNTIWGNLQDGISFLNDRTLTLESNLFVANGEYGLHHVDLSFTVEPVLEANLFWDNALGNYSSPAGGGSVLNTAAQINTLPLSTGNLATDPFLCDPPTVFGVCATSPAVGAGLNGTTIGAREEACGALYSSYGTGLAGTGGLVPALDGAGCTSPGFAVVGEVSSGRGGAPGILGISFATASIPVFGGTLLLAPPILRVPHVLGGPSGVAGAGSASVEVAVPPDPALLGRPLALQALYLDPETPAGVSMTGGLSTTIR